MQTFTLQASGKTTRFALALVAAFALVLSLLSPVSPAHASGTHSITQISPTIGIGGTSGTNVTITGTGLASATSVIFGGQTILANAFVSNTSTAIVVKAPTQTSGNNPSDITVVIGSNRVKINSAFTYRSTMAPSVSSVSPATGLATGFNTVVISGSNFTGATAVRFGATNPVAAVAFSVLSDSRISAVVPEGVSGTSIRVSVVTPNGTSASAVNYSYRTSTCVPGRYLTTTFNYRSSTLTTAQKRKIRAAADELVLLGCESVELLRYTGVRAGSPAAYKSYLTLSNRRANNMMDVFTKRLTNRGVTMQVTEVKRANQKSQRRVANWDSRASYRKLNIRVAVSEGIDVVYPSAGPTTGGGTVTITGRGFTNLAATGAVRFGLNASPSYTVNVTGTKIIATVPAGLASNSSISIQRGVPGTRTAKVFTRGYTYVATPTITSLNLTAGSIVGGTTVTITGTNFTGVTGVNFGSNRALSYTVNSSTSITAVAPAGAEGAVGVEVVAGGVTTTPATFTYRSSPTVVSATPASGALAGGTSVVIAGTGFSGVSGATSVKFGANNATSYVVNSATQITAVSPVGTGVVSVTVANAYGSSELAAAYTYTSVPTIASLAPAVGATDGGTSVVITGTNFVNVTGAASVKFGANNATSYVVNSPTQITAVAPAGSAGNVNVTVTNLVGVSVSTATFTYAIAPTISSLTPAAGPVGGTTSVVIVGTGFTGTSGAASVKFGANNATSYTVDSATQITAVAPAGTGAVNVTVTNGGVTSTSTATYTYVVAPTISSLTPSTGPDGGTTSVVIVGTGFSGISGAASVKFGANNAASYVVNSDTQITAVAPAGSGTVSVTVTNAGGTSTSTANYIYTAP